MNPMDYRRLKWAAKQTAVIFAAAFAILAVIGGLVWLLRDVVESELVRDTVLVAFVFVVVFAAITALWYLSPAFETGESLWRNVLHLNDDDKDD